MNATHQATQLHASRREELTRGSLRQLRDSGRIPAVIYGGTESLAIHVDAKELAKFSRTGRSEFFDLNVEGEGTFPALIKEIQQRRGVVSHVDFQKVSKNKPMRVKVPLHLTGTAEGTKVGGVLQVQAVELEVEGLPDDLPAGIEVDITSLNTGDKLTAADVTLPEGVTLLASEEELLASIVLPRVAEEDVETDAGTSEPTAEAEDDEAKASEDSAE